MCFHYFFSFPIKVNSPSPSGFLSAARIHTHLLQSSSSLSLSLFFLHAHRSLTAKAYKQYLHVVLNLHNHTFVTTSTKHSMAIQFPTKTSILYFFFWGGGESWQYSLLEMIFDFHNATLCPSFLSLLSLQPWMLVFLRSLINTSSLDYLHIYRVWAEGSHITNGQLILYLYVNRY